MEEMPSLNMPVQWLKTAILQLDLPCSGPVTPSGEILTIGKSHGKKPDSNETLFPNWQKELWQTFEETSEYMRPERVKRLLNT